MIGKIVIPAIESDDSDFNDSESDDSDRGDSICCDTEGGKNSGGNISIAVIITSVVLMVA